MEVLRSGERLSTAVDGFSTVPTKLPVRCHSCLTSDDGNPRNRMRNSENEKLAIDVDTDTTPEAQQAIRRVRETIHSIRIAMLTTADDHGHLRSRPMTTQQSEADDELWFYMDARSGII